MMSSVSCRTRHSGTCRDLRDTVRDERTSELENLIRLNRDSTAEKADHESRGRCDEAAQEITFPIREGWGESSDESG